MKVAIFSEAQRTKDKLAALLVFLAITLPNAYCYAGRTDGIMRGNRPENFANTKYKRIHYEVRTETSPGPARLVPAIHYTANSLQHSRSNFQGSSYFEDMWGGGQVSSLFLMSIFIKNQISLTCSQDISKTRGAEENAKTRRAEENTVVSQLRDSESGLDLAKLDEFERE